MTPSEEKEFNRLVNKVEEGDKHYSEVHNWIDLHVANRVSARDHQIAKVVERLNPGAQSTTKSIVISKIKDLPAPDLKQPVFIDKG